MSVKLPTISVVMPVRNEAAFIEQTLKSVIGQDYPEDCKDIIVVDGLSTDSTVEIVERISQVHKNVRCLSNPKRLSAAARNIGAKNAKGEIVLYVDGHVHIDNDQLLKSVAELMTTQQVSVLSRPQLLNTPDNTLMQNAVAHARKSWFGHGSDSSIYTMREDYVNPSSSGAAYRREIFETVGYFDEEFDASEDYEFNYRVHIAGFKSFTSPRLTVYYYPRTTFRALFRQMYRYGLGRFRLARKHPSTISLPSLVPAALILLPIVLSIIPADSVPGKVAIFLCCLYILLVVLTSMIISIRQGLRLFPRLLLIFPTIHFGLGIGYWAGLVEKITGRRLT